MKFWISTLFLLLALACAKQPPTLSPAGAVAFQADSVLVRVGELQDATIEANTKGLIGRPVAEKIVMFTVESAKVLKATTGDWRKTIRDAWTALQSSLTGLPQSLKAIIAAINSLLGGA